MKQSYLMTMKKLKNFAKDFGFAYVISESCLDAFYISTQLLRSCFLGFSLHLFLVHSALRKICF